MPRSQRDRSGPILGDLSNKRRSWVSQEDPSMKHRFQRIQTAREVIADVTCLFEHTRTFLSPQFSLINNAFPFFLNTSRANGRQITVVRSGALRRALLDVLNYRASRHELIRIALCLTRTGTPYIGRPKRIGGHRSDSSYCRG
jgi:hypothetical protein